MAFVYRNSQKQNSNDITPGPGAYYKKNISKQQLNSAAPFNNSSNRQLWKFNNTPGPGSYQTALDIKKQNKLIADEIGQMIVYEAPKQTVQFKSKTRRFTQKSNEKYPGPGDYYFQDDKLILNPKKHKKKASNKLKQFLKERNKNTNFYDETHRSFTKQLIRTITNDQEQYLQNNQLTILKNKASKNSTFFASKVQRQSYIRPLTSAGPGSYNINKSSFQVQKKSFKNYQTKSLVTIQKDKTQNQLITHVGPGYYKIQQAYNNLNKNNSRKNKKLQCFGSTVDRFQQNKKQKKIIPGPASYQILASSCVAERKNRKKLNRGTFTQSKRNIFLNNTTNPNISPGAYGTFNDFSSLIKDKFKKKSKGNFGSNQERFDQSKDIFFTNSILNTSQIKHQFNPNDQIFGQKSSFKRIGLKKKNQLISNFSIQRSQKQVQQQYRPINYDNLSNTISSKYFQRIQKQAPFLSTQERFKCQNDQNLIDLGRTQKKEQKKQFKNQLKKKPLRNCKSACLTKKSRDTKNGLKLTQSRFKQPNQKNNQLGPQYYNPLIPSKKSYNILFN